MSITTFTPKRPKYLVAKFYGPEAIPDILELAGQDDFTLTNNGPGYKLAVAGLTLKYQDLLVRAPDGTLSVMSVRDLNNDFERME